MCKNPGRRNLMVGVLSADVVSKQDEGVQTARSLFQGWPTSGPCDCCIGLDVDIASFCRKIRKLLEQRFCISQLKASRPSQSKIAIDGLHQPGHRSPPYG